MEMAGHRRDGTTFAAEISLSAIDADQGILGAERLYGYPRANAYVRKPVKFSAFAEAVNAIGVFWLFLSEPMPDAISTMRPATP
jgi:hypothetical protein